MKLLVFLCLSVLPNSCLFFKIENDVPESYISAGDFVFPKDRQPSITGRIIGGEEVVPHAYPFMAGLLLDHGTEYYYFCGGSLIYPGWVLTAAHCFFPAPIKIYVILGAHNVTADIETGRIALQTTNYIVHEHWSNTTLQNDVALVKLPQNVTLTKYITTVELAKGDATYAKEKGTLIGWGRTETITSDVSPVLRRVNSTILSNSECRAIDPYDQIVAATHLCTSGTGPIGSCNGDSGGPLIANDVQVGITSFGYKSCTAGKPTVFTRVTDFNDWIERKVRGGANQSVSCAVIVTLATLLARLYN